MYSLCGKFCSIVLSCCDVQVFDQLRLTAYDLSVDMLDVHAVSIFGLLFACSHVVMYILSRLSRFIVFDLTCFFINVIS